jgi:hypothetical protein
LLSADFSHAELSLLLPILSYVVLLVALLELGLSTSLLGVGDDEREGREGAAQSFSL